ncbi:phosphoenolpyruvate--protein phosphotransferase [Rarobacter incanus]|uniref:Phosphoenolpyruvate-protein phosphotransferase n=1 Tax=Rarobacter incanus TaxID=153494 RepID=A0A542SQ39_9MICO|nr:putative PEP-binding protein [Rarobacter incanus]TQK76712.1 phosphoenolpyruvate--protein phosphotransferase [Rarobacter incanus]
MEPRRTSTVLSGTPVVGGMAYAPAALVHRPLAPPTHAPELPPERRGQAAEEFSNACSLVHERLAARAEQASGHAAEVLSMTAGLATDRGWQKEALKRIAAGTPPVQATWGATNKFVEMFERAGGLMAERTTDLRDVRDRVVAALQGDPEPGIPAPSTPVVLVADDLSPADTATLDAAVFVAIVTQLGGPTSHTAIIARQLGIPCIVALKEAPAIADGAPVLVDGTAGEVTLDADPSAALAAVAADSERRARIAAWQGPGRTADGVAVSLLANVKDGASARAAAAGDAQGVGLFRTELLFLSTPTEPSVADQAAEYGKVCEAFPRGKVVLRTLDAGSDKPVPFATMADEENPALGVRGIRLAVDNPALITHQLDAAQRAAAANPECDLWVMAPMIATVAEARDFASQVRARGLKAGIMIEVPSTVLLIDAFLQEVDFASIGTNDLTQYTMAADRLSPQLAGLTTPWQPAVLRLIAQAGAGGQRASKPVGVCGEAAADPLLACVLHGMGITSLSMAPSSIPAVGAQLAHVTDAQCKDAAASVLTARDDQEARAIARDLLT